MKTYFLDFETYFDKDYSLRKMTPAEYILDPRFEVTYLAVQEGVDGIPYEVHPNNIQAFFDSLDPSNTILVSFNYLFDGCIIAWRYNFVPRLMLCMLAAARATVGHAMRKGCALKEVASYLGIGVKTETILKVVGMDRAQIEASGLLEEYGEYCKNDTKLVAEIYKKLVMTKTLPVSELVVMDMVLRCAVVPRFIYDREMLAQHKHVIAIEKERLLAEAMLLGAEGKGDLMSNDRFAQLLQSVGCDPPTKVSLATGLETWAFSKQDEEFMALEEHDNPAVQALVGARLGHKSTLEETRTQRLINISNLTWPATFRGNQPNTPWAPVPLRYAGAHTHRLSGEWKLNKQNFSRPKNLILDPRQEKGKLRRALTVSEDEAVVAADSSQIEARLVVTLCGATSVVELFRSGLDVYSTFAELVFGHPINKHDYPDERFCGKQGVLGLGYGLGWVKFSSRLRTDSLNQTGKMIILPDDKVQRIVNTYRNEFAPEVQKGWRKLNYDGLRVLSSGGTMHFGPCVFEKGRIVLPNGLCLWCDNLRWFDNQWQFTYGGKTKHIYGPKVLEWICQALARIIIMDAALRVLHRTGYHFAHQVHDELVYVVKRVDAERIKQILREEMTRSVAWLPELPLGAEVGEGATYGDAK